MGALLLLTRRMKSARVDADIDWSLLLMFAGLFIIVAGAQHALLTPDLAAAVGRLHLDRVPGLAAVTAVLVMRPLVDALPNHSTAWLVIAMASTLAGNFIVLGSVANLIVVEKAAARGVPISAWRISGLGDRSPSSP
jgi:Na+/H+ antiporter NhaD/arsenite permease-like protein